MEVYTPGCEESCGLGAYKGARLFNDVVVLTEENNIFSF